MKQSDLPRVRRRARNTFSGFDWPRILGDIAWCLGEEIAHLPGCRTPVGVRLLGEYLDLPRGTLRRWLEEDAEPRHIEGEFVIDEWMTLAGKGREFLPVRCVTLSAFKLKGP